MFLIVYVLHSGIRIVVFINFSLLVATDWPPFCVVILFNASSSCQPCCDSPPR